MWTERGLIAVPNRDGVILLTADRQNATPLPVFDFKPQRQRSNSPSCTQGHRPISNDLYHAIVDRTKDWPVVVQEQIGHIVQFGQASRK